MAQVQWRFMLANSSDLSNVGELTQARGRSLSLTHNKPGSASFQIPMDDVIGNQIWPITHAVKAYRRSSAGAWQLVWSGMVWTIDEDVTGNMLNVNCVGWLQWLDKRIMRRTKNYTGNNPTTGVPWTDADIIFDLLADANATTITWLGTNVDSYTVPTIYTVTDAGVQKVLPTPLGKGTATGSFTTHQRPNYAVQQNAQILTEINRLTEIENGCDVYVDPATRTLNIYDKKMTDRPSAIFGFNWGPNNIQDFHRQIDPSTIVNYMYASGPAGLTPAVQDSKGFPAPSQNPPKLGENSMTTYGLIEENAALTEAKNTEILATYAAGEVLLRSSPRIVYSITPFPFTSGSSGRIPEPFVDYGLGDKVYLTAKSGRMQVVNQGLRIFGMTVTIDDDGNETIGSLQTNPA